MKFQMLYLPPYGGVLVFSYIFPFHPLGELFTFPTRSTLLVPLAVSVGACHFPSGSTTPCQTIHATLSCHTST